MKNHFRVTKIYREDNTANRQLYKELHHIILHCLIISSDGMVSFCRLSLTIASFIPSTIKVWNRLHPSIYDIDIGFGLKMSIRNNLSKTPKYIFYNILENKTLICLFSMFIFVFKLWFIQCWHFVNSSLPWQSTTRG